MTIPTAPKHLPGIGGAIITKCAEPGHYLWLSLFGWHDCTPNEDKAIRDAEKSNRS